MDLFVEIEMEDDMDVVELEADEPNNANLPVAVRVRDLHDRQRRRLRLQMRGRDFLGQNDDGAPILQRMDIDENVLMPWMHTEAEESSSPFLLDLIREDLPCSSVLSGANIRGCTCIVQRIIDNPDEVGYRCPRTGRTPLHEAAFRCSCRHVIHAMLEAGRNRALQLDFRMNTPLHLLFMGISTRHIEVEDMDQILDVLLEPIPTIGTIRNGDGSVPLHCACSAPESMLPPGVIDRLIRVSSASVGRLNSLGQTPLHLHCQRRDASTSVAEKLLDSAPDSLHLRDRTSGRGFSPLHYAALNCNHALMKLLTKRDPLSASVVSMFSSRTPLHILCQQNLTTHEDLESVQCLLEADPGAATRTDQNTLFTPLHLICRGTRGIYFPIVEALVRTAPEALLIQDFNGYLPLHHACENGADATIIKCLLDSGKQAAFMQTRKNDTALSLACTTNKSVESVKLLLEANPAATLQPNDYGFLPIHCSCRAYQAQVSIVRELLRACPQSVLKTTNGGESAIHLASSNSSASVGILDMLTKTFQSLREENDIDEIHPLTMRDKNLTSTVGNTPRKWFVAIYNQML